MKIKLSLIFTCSVIVALLIAGCVTQPSPTTTSEQVAIGALVDLSGESASLGKSAAPALEMAARDVNTLLNETGSTKRVALTVKDSGTDPAKALQALENLSKNGINVVIAATTSAELAGMKDYADDHGITIISTDSTASSLAITNDNIIRLVANDTNQGLAMAQLLTMENVSAIVPITRGDVWGDDLLNATTANFKAKGGTVLEGVRYAPGTNFSAEVADLRARTDEATSRFGSANVGIYLISLDEAASLFALAANDATLSSVRWFGSDGLASSEVITKNRSVAQFANTTRLICTGYGVPWMVKQTDDYQRVANAYRQETGYEFTGYVATSYDAVWAASLSTMLAESTSDSGRQEMMMQIIDRYNGVTYHLKLNAAGDRESACYDFQSVTGDNGEYVWQSLGQFISWDTGDDEMIWSGQIGPLRQEGSPSISDLLAR